MKIDISKFEKEKKPKKPVDDEAPEAAEGGPPSGTARAMKAEGRHKTRRIASEAALNDVLPWHFEPGDIWHCISHGDVDSLTYLRVIVKQQRVRYLLISTWCMAGADIQEIGSWLDAGYLQKVDFYVGEIFTSRYANEFVLLKEICSKYGGRVALFRNHSKVMAGFGDRFDFVIESSANVNTNPRCEQACISCDAELARGYKDFYDEIRSFDHEFDDWTITEV